MPDPFPPYVPSASELAHAKINLALHVLERLENGYHALDSVATFVDVADMLTASVIESGYISLAITGAYAEGLSAEENLVIRAAHTLKAHSGISMGAEITLVKNIPVGAGLGGGSADAAAALRLLNRLWSAGYSLDALAELGEQLGADVPACVHSHPVRMQGVGEKLTKLRYAPELYLLLVYPNVPSWTADIYRAMQSHLFSGALSFIPESNAWLEWMQTNRNDLEEAATALNPQISAVFEALAALDGNVFTRMSGSGSACFGVFTDKKALLQAEAQLQTAHPKWWVRACKTVSLYTD